MQDSRSPILRLDITGKPVKWIPWQNAVSLYTRDMIAWTAGESKILCRGGINRNTGKQSVLELNSIIAIRCSITRKKVKFDSPPLVNRELFRRDAYLCMYCGNNFSAANLTRDHVLPLSKGGKDNWSNVVTACRRCNSKKGGRKPEEAKMPLLAIPYNPNWAEYLALSNRRILADQMEFLKSQFTNTTRLINSVKH